MTEDTKNKLKKGAGIALTIASLYPAGKVAGLAFKGANAARKTKVAKDVAQLAQKKASSFKMPGQKKPVKVEYGANKRGSTIRQSKTWGEGGW